jgi:predicted amidophosphoribosyltransferase
MVCIACAAPDPDVICRACRVSIRPGPIRRLPGDVEVAAATIHAGAARRLVHRLKYQGLVAAAEVLASAMAASLPPGAQALVPLPRAGIRRWQYGVDPARLLARTLARRTGLELISGLRSTLWWPRHAGRSRLDRVAPRFRILRPPDPGWVFIDDVVTSGSTMLAAVAATDWAVRLGITATGVGTLESTAVTPSDSPGRLRGASAANEPTKPC